MKYINTKNLLPDTLVKELQSYIQGAIFMSPPSKRSKNDGEKRLATGRGCRNASPAFCLIQLDSVLSGG